MSLSKMLSQGNSIGSNAVAILEVFTGAFPSAMGAGCVLALLGALAFLTIRRPKDAISAYTFMFASHVAIPVISKTIKLFDIDYFLYEINNNHYIGSAENAFVKGAVGAVTFVNKK
jgi:hypothetical protein